MTIRERFQRTAQPSDPARRRTTDRPPIRVNDRVVAWVDHDGTRHDIEGNDKPMIVHEIRNGFVKVLEVFPRSQYHDGGVKVPPPPLRLLFAVDDSEDGRWHGWTNIRAAGLIRHNDTERRVIGDVADEPLTIEAWEANPDQHHEMRVVPAEAPTW